MSRYKTITRSPSTPHALSQSMKFFSDGRNQRSGNKKLFRLFLFVFTTSLAGLIVWQYALTTKQPITTEPPQLTVLESTFDIAKYPLDKPHSLWWIVSKTRPLQPQDYAPIDLVNPTVSIRLEPTNEEMLVRKEVAVALETMFQASKRESLDLILVSGFRSYQFQVNVYNHNIQQLGEANAREVIAQPGTSEHQTGLAVDIGGSHRHCEVEVCFRDTPEGKWLAAHAHEYGFNLRYPNDKAHITGYSYEPWHFRYVGKELAAEMNKRNIQTLEEFFAEELNKGP